MRLRFSGLMHPLAIEPGKVSVLEVHNRRLFSRICQSIASLKGEQAVEPFALWDENGEVRPSEALLLSFDPFSLPWDDRRLTNGLLSSIDAMVLEDERVRGEIESLASRLSSRIASLCFQVEGDYRFGIEWELRRYLKAFAFDADRNADDSLIDNLIKYLDFVADVALNQTMVFANLKVFLDEKELARFYERVFFRKNKVVLLETIADDRAFGNEIKLCVDQDFLEI